MKKWIAAIAGVLAAPAIAACGSDNEFSEATSQWGAPLVAALDSCDPAQTATYMSCQQAAIEAAAPDAPASEEPVIDLFRTEYAHMVSEGCESALEMTCIITQKQVQSLIDSLRTVAATG